MKSVQKILKLPGNLSAAEWAFLSLPLLLFISYLPHIYLGVSSGANLDISLLHIGLGIFSLLSLPTIWRCRYELLRKRVVQVVFVFGGLALLSLLWTPNIVRGSLAVLLIILIISSFLGFITLKRLPKLLPAFARLLIGGAIITSIFAWYQIIGEALGLSPAFTFLPDNYRSGVFGFARPTGFAQEPQFLGSQLLAPILYMAYRSLRNKKIWHEGLVLFLLFATLIATVSRGAIVAALIGIGIMMLVHIKNIRKLFQTSLVLIAATVLSLSALGAMATIKSESRVSFYGAISKTINHVSLGIIELPQATQIDSAASPDASKDGQPLSTTGYVEASTNERLTMNEMALNTMTESLQTLLFGVGIGGTGFAYHDRYGCPESCINFVEYLDIGVELGLSGLVLFAVLIGVLIVKSPLRVLVIAYIFQWLFFAGYPNSLPVFIMLGLLGALVVRPVEIQRGSHE